MTSKAMRSVADFVSNLMSPQRQSGRKEDPAKNAPVPETTGKSAESDDTRRRGTMGKGKEKAGPTAREEVGAERGPSEEQRQSDDLTGDERSESDVNMQGSDFDDDPVETPKPFSKRTRNMFETPRPRKPSESTQEPGPTKKKKGKNQDSSSSLPEGALPPPHRNSDGKFYYTFEGVDLEVDALKELVKQAVGRQDTRFYDHDAQYPDRSTGPVPRSPESNPFDESNTTEGPSGEAPEAGSAESEKDSERTGGESATGSGAGEGSTRPAETQSAGAGKRPSTTAGQNKAGPEGGEGSGRPSAQRAQSSETGRESGTVPGAKNTGLGPGEESRRSAEAQSSRSTGARKGSGPSTESRSSRQGTGARAPASGESTYNSRDGGREGDVDQEEEPTPLKVMLDSLEEMRGLRDDIRTALVGSSNNSQSRRPRGDQVRRDADINDFHAKVRAKLAFLLDPYGEEDDLGLDRESVARFNEEWKENKGHDMEDHCTADEFNFDIDSDPHAGWNVSSARVFAAFFLEDEGLPEDDYKTLKLAENAFIQRIKYLRKKASQRRDDPTGMKHRRNSNSRKEGDYQRRRKAAKHYPALRPHLEMLELFGMSGMSSDESLNEGGVKKYIRLENRYRHPDVTRWLRVFDRAYEVWRRARTDIDQRGSLARIREDRGEVNLDPRIPTGLPSNAFEPEWYKKQNATWIRSEVQVSRRRYKFVHDPDFLRYLAEEERKAMASGRPR